MKISTCFILSCLLFTQVSLAKELNPPEAKKNTSEISKSNTYHLKHKPLAFLKTKVQDGKVQVRFVRKGCFRRKNYDDLFSKFRIYRRKIDFILNKDSTELCDGLVCKDADLIYEGPIKLLDGTSGVYIYTDEDVSVGQTYAYWAAAAEGEPIGPCPSKVRDPQVCWPLEKVIAQMNDLQKAYPDLVKITTAGKTIKGKEIVAIEVGTSKNKVALIGGIHAAESGPELIIPIIRSLLENHNELFNEISIVAIPIVNLDQRQKYAQGTPWYLRANVAAVDLNRNFPGNWEEISYSYGGSNADPEFGTYRGPSPASEPETQAVMSFIRQHRPAVVLSFHCLASVTGRLFLAPDMLPEDEAFRQKCKKIHEFYSQGYCAHFPDEGYEKEKPGKNFMEAKLPGTLGMWCYQELRIPSFDVELHKGSCLKKALTDEVDGELLTRTQQQHAEALLNLLKNMKTLKLID